MSSRINGTAGYQDNAGSQSARSSTSYIAGSSLLAESCHPKTPRFRQGSSI